MAHTVISLNRSDIEGVLRGMNAKLTKALKRLVPKACYTVHREFNYNSVFDQVENLLAYYMKDEICP